MNNDNPIEIIDSMIESLKTDDIDNSMEMLSPRQVAEELSLHINTVYRIIGSGQLRVYNLSSRQKSYYRISREDMQEYLSERYSI